MRDESPSRGTGSRRRDGRLAVTLHDIEPATFERCALIREWLDDLGVRRVTLCVVPAADHPVLRHSPALTDWLWERRDAGDAIARPDLGAHAVGASPEPGGGFGWWIAAGRVRAGSVRRGGTVRVDLHPDDFRTHPGRTRTLERTLQRAARDLRPVTYDELAAGETLFAR